MQTSQHRLIFPFLLVCYEIAIYFSNDMYLPALPAIMKDLHMTTQEAQLTLTAWFLGSALLPLIMGVISDRCGRRPVLLIGGIFFVVSSIACALAVNSTQLLISRFVQGSMMASMLVAGYATIHESHKQKEAIQILALMGSVTILAPAFGPLFGSLVLSAFNWRAIFWVISIWAAIMIFWLYYLMPETHPSEKRISIPLKDLFMHYWRVISHPKFIVLMLILGLMFQGFIAWITASPLLVIETYGKTTLVYGMIQAIVFGAYIIGNRFVKPLLEEVGIYKLVDIGLNITLIGGVLVYALAHLYSHNLYTFLIGMCIYSFGSALCFSSLNRLLIETSDEPMGLTVALVTVFITTFAVLSSALTSFFFHGEIIVLAYLIVVPILLSNLLRFFYTP